MNTRAVPHSVVGIAAVLALVLAGCSSGASIESPTGPSPSPSPSVEPTDSPSPITGRDSSMTDLEALARLVSPQTGESWFETPRKIATPSWASGDEYLDQDWVGWYELGSRDGKTIVGFSADTVEEVFERSAEGMWEWIPFPSARDVVGPTADYFGYATVPANASVYYDSLTLPAAFTLPTGERLLSPDFDRGSEFIPGRESTSVSGSSVVDRAGGYEILRFESSVRLIWSDVYEVTNPSGLTFKEFFYILKTPYGMYIPLEYDPLGSLSEISWTIPETVTSQDYVWWTDVNDIGCGPRDSDHNSLVRGLADSDWTQAGTTPGGGAIYIPTGANPLVPPIYDSYVALVEGFGETPVPLAGYLTIPGMIGLKNSGTNDWTVFLNGSYTGRGWC